MVLPGVACRPGASATPVIGLPAVVAEGEPRIEWIRVPVASGGALRAAVALPVANGRFPAVLLLHGSHGFAQEYVRLARDLARSGVVAIAACWFEAGVGAGTRFVTAVPCPDAPPIVLAASPAAQERVDALVEAVRALPQVRGDRIALLGHSRGGGAALHYALGVGGVQALILNSTGYPAEIVARAGDVRAAILLLHGTRDDPADGGSTVTGIARARAFEAALQAAGKAVEVTYFEAGHNEVFASAVQYDATVRRVTTFLRQRLEP